MAVNNAVMHGLADGGSDRLILDWAEAEAGGAQRWRLGAGKQAPKSVQAGRKGGQRLRETPMVYEGKVISGSMVAQRSKKD